MSVEQNFSQWYSQLSSSDQKALCDFLRNWLSQSSGNTSVKTGKTGRGIDLSSNPGTAGGTDAGGRTFQSSSKKSKVECPKCHHKFDS